LRQIDNPSVPTVSVLIAAHNDRRYVGEAVASVLRQYYEDLELVVVDDGSTDGTADVLRHMARHDSRMRVIRQRNQGRPRAANTGLALCRGRYIARLDADDIAEPKRLTRQVAFLNEHEEVVCVGSAASLVDSSGRHLTHLAVPTKDAQIQEQVLAGHGAIFHPSAMMRRETLEAIGGYDVSFDCALDIDLWLRLGEMGALANLATPLIRYRLHGRAVSEREGQRQRRLSHLACERAWQRRGIRGRFEAGYRWRPGQDRHTQYLFRLRYGWWAFNARQRRTAMIYGLKAIAMNPHKQDGWKLLACSLVKPLPEQANGQRECADADAQRRAVPGNGPALDS